MPGIAAVETAKAAATTLSVWPFRFHFRALDSVHFPDEKATNILRGAFGTLFRRLACVPECQSVNSCHLSATCPYARIFEPKQELLALDGGPSGLADWPRPFVFRGLHLNGRTIAPGQEFYFDLILFDPPEDALPYFVLAFRELVRTGLGPGRGRATLTLVQDLSVASTESTPPDTVGRAFLPAGHLSGGLSPSTAKSVDERSTNPENPAPSVPSSIHDAAADPVVAQTLVSAAPRLVSALFQQPAPTPPPSAILYSDNHFTGLSPQPLHFDLSAISPQPTHRITIEFLTPTELKSAGTLIEQPEFAALFARLRDRLSNLRACYQGGPLDIDFRSLGDAARQIRLVHTDLRTITAARQSSRTGQHHPIGGFIGSAEYEGDLGVYLPFLRAAQWTGVGRQTVWGKGQLILR